MRGKVLQTRSLWLFVLPLVAASLFAEGSTAQIKFGQMDPETKVKTAYIVDPMGMRVALTEGLPTRW